MEGGSNCIFSEQKFSSVVCAPKSGSIKNCTLSGLLILSLTKHLHQMHEYVEQAVSIPVVLTMHDDN